MFHTHYNPEYLTSDIITEEAVHAFATRRGGVSTGIFESLNLGLSRGDDPKALYENYRRLGAAVGFTPEQTVLVNHAHSGRVDRMGKADRGMGLFFPQKEHQDGLYTNEPGVALVVFTADCTPILLHDPVKHVVAAVHSGWPGTAKGIVYNCVNALVRDFGCNPADLEAAIGPSIGSCCFETDRDVPEAMVKALGPEAEPLSFITHEGAPEGKFFPDVKAINVLWLHRCGVEKIDVSEDCTKCRPDRFWSHRVTGLKRGNMGNVIMLKEE